jgi:DNA-binding NarL/FixJ family response regulator
MSRIKTLLVDDHAIMRDAIRALLSQHDDIEIVGEASRALVIFTL